MILAVLKYHAVIVAISAATLVSGCQEEKVLSKQIPSSDLQKNEATQSDISRVLLKCDSASLLGGQAFCAVVSHSLEARGMRVTPYTGQAAQTLSSEQVILEVLSLQPTQDVLSLQLKWTYGATGQTDQSERADLRVMDADMTVEMYDQFVQRLIQPKILPFL